MTTAIVRKARSLGFTLVELIAVMVVLAVLAGVAVPKYFNYADQAKTSGLQGALGGVRAGVANFYTNSAFSGTAAFPTLTQMTTLGAVMQQPIPQNPYNKLSNVRQVTSQANATNRTVSQPTQFGWNYYINNTSNPPVAIFWANSDNPTTVTSSSGAVVTANNL